MADERLEVEVIHAEDWCYHPDQKNRYSEFDTIDAVIVGFLIYEDDEKVVLTHQWFPGQDDVRHTSVITKHSIIERRQARIKSPRKRKGKK